jgi:polysaccharide biosynthesis transport protein
VAYSDHFPNSASISGERTAIADALLKPTFIYNLMVRHYRRIAAIAIVTFIALASLILLMAPHYSGTAIVLVDPRQQRVLQSDAVLSGIGNDMAAVDSQVEVIQSAQIASKVISELKLDQDPEFLPANGVLELLRSMVSDQRESRARYVLSQFERNLKVRRRGVTYILEIEFLSRSAEKAARIANAIANAYVELQAGAKSSATSDASKWLGDRLTDLRKQAREAEAAVVRYKEENSLVNTGDKRSVVEQQLADTNQQLTVARLRVEEVRARLKQIEKAASDPAARSSLVDALSSPVIAGLRAQYAAAAKTNAELSQSLGPLHPALKTSTAELAAISRQIDMEIGRLSLGVRHEYDAAQERERSLDAILKKLKTAMGSNDQLTVRLHELERESEAAQAILQRSLARYKETKEQEGVQSVEVQVISPATVPLTPNGPNRKLLLAIAAIASGLFGVAVTLVTDRLNLRLRASSDFSSLGTKLRLPIIGYLPAASMVGAVDSSASRPSPFEDAIRRLISDFGVVLQRPYVIAMTGATAGSGASSVASAFAEAHAKEGFSTLLVDATVRPLQNSQTQQRFGLLHAIRGALSVDFAISKGGHGSPDVLHCGFTNDVDFAAVLDSDVIAAIFNKLRTKYRIIAINTGVPITGVQSRRFIALADSALLVVGGDEVAVAGEGTLQRSIDDCYAKLDGAVVNKVSLGVYQDYERRLAATMGSSTSTLRKTAAG